MDNEREEAIYTKLGTLFINNKTEKLKAYIQRPNRKVHREAVDRMEQGLNGKHSTMLTKLLL
jgi:hypothetical protein